MAIELDFSARLRLRATLVIDAHGTWEGLPSDRLQRRLARSAADLFAFKANFRGGSLPAGAISVLAQSRDHGVQCSGLHERLVSVDDRS